jgi:hypothetical protein
LEVIFTLKRKGPKNGMNSAPDVYGADVERNDTDKTTIPITYPSKRYRKTKAAMPSDDDVKEAKDWVDHNIK